VARLEVAEQREHLRLDALVEGADGFVGHQQVRVEVERPREREALFLSAGEFVRIPVVVRGGQTDSFEEVFSDRSSALSLGQSMGCEWLDDRLTDRHARVETRRRVLKDHPCASAKALEGRAVVLADVLTVEDDSAASRFFEPEHSPRSGRFPTAGLADQADYLAATDVEADAIDGAYAADLAT